MTVLLIQGVISNSAAILDVLNNGFWTLLNESLNKVHPIAVGLVHCLPAETALNGRVRRPFSQERAFAKGMGMAGQA